MKSANKLNSNMSSQQVPEASTTSSTAGCSNMDDIDHDVPGYDSDYSVVLRPPMEMGSDLTQILEPESEEDDADEEDTSSNTTTSRRVLRRKLFGSAVEGITVWKTLSSEVLYDNDVVDYFHLSREDLPSCMDIDYHIMDMFNEDGKEGEMAAPYVHLHLCTSRCKKVTFNKEVMCEHVNKIKGAHFQHLMNEEFKNQ